MAETFNFPLGYTLDNIRASIVSANRKTLGHGDTSWQNSTFTLQIDGEQHKISAETFIG
jgi:hypothetical protein